MSYKEKYEQLRKRLTDEEIAESYLIPEDLSEEERAEVNEEIRRYRFKLLREQTEKDRLFAELMKLRILMREYLDKEPYSEEQTFGRFLGEYLHILNKTQKDFAEDISLHPTKLSRLLNDREDPNVGLVYRLEKHSGGLLPALLWWKLLVKKQAHQIREDEATRREEAAKVKNELQFRA